MDHQFVLSQMAQPFSCIAEAALPLTNHCSVTRTDRKLFTIKISLLVDCENILPRLMD